MFADERVKLPSRKSLHTLSQKVEQHTEDLTRGWGDGSVGKVVKFANARMLVQLLEPM